MQIDTPNRIYTPAKPDRAPVLPAGAVKPVKDQKQRDPDGKPTHRRQPDNPDVNEESSAFDDYA